MRRHRMNHFDEDGYLTHKGKKLYMMYNNNKRNAEHVTLADFEANFEPIDPDLGLTSSLLCLTLKNVATTNGVFVYIVIFFNR